MGELAGQSYPDQLRVLAVDLAEWTASRAVERGVIYVVLGGEREYRIRVESAGEVEIRTVPTEHEMRMSSGSDHGVQLFRGPREWLRDEI